MPLRERSRLELRAALTGNKADLLTLLKAEQVQKDPEAAVTQTEAPSLRVPERPPVVGMESLRDHRPVCSGRSGPTCRERAPVSAVSEEIARLEAELTRLQTEETARRSEIEAERLAAENALRVEQERWRKA